jgi:hypothetical protein
MTTEGLVGGAALAAGIAARRRVVIRAAALTILCMGFLLCLSGAVREGPLDRAVVKYAAGGRLVPLKGRRWRSGIRRSSPFLSRLATGKD